MTPNDSQWKPQIHQTCWQNDLGTLEVPSEWTLAPNYHQNCAKVVPQNSKMPEKSIAKTSNNQLTWMPAYRNQLTIVLTADRKYTWSEFPIAWFSLWFQSCNSSKSFKPFWSASGQPTGCQRGRRQERSLTIRRTSSEVAGRAKQAFNTRRKIGGVSLPALCRSRLCRNSLITDARGPSPDRGKSSIGSSLAALWGQPNQVNAKVGNPWAICHHYAANLQHMLKVLRIQRLLLPNVLQKLSIQSKCPAFPSSGVLDFLHKSIEAPSNSASLMQHLGNPFCARPTNLPHITICGWLQRACYEARHLHKAVLRSAYDPAK